VRSLQTFARRSRQCYVCASSQFPARQFSTTVSRAEEHQESQSTDRPRWSYTPELMKAPFSPRIKDPNKAWESNNDPQKLDAMYSKMLGRGGENFLTEEVKWLAVTHKSFDQGRRGFNDRLAFFGKLAAVSQWKIEHGNMDAF
jgi:large subunit ribosomal protein L15